MARKILLEDIRAEVEKEGWKVLSDSYQNLNSEMIFECPEGHKVYSPWKKLRSKLECPHCKKTLNKLNNHEIIPKKNGKKRVLGLDQATKITGWSIFDGTELTHYGLYETSYSNRDEKIADMKNWLITMLENWKPDYVVLEDIQYQKKFGEEYIEDAAVGVTTFKALAHLQGVLINLLLENKIDYEVVPSATWRSHCGITGKTRNDKKKSCQLKIKEWYNVNITNDEADAICIGKYGVEHNSQQNEMIFW